MTTCPHRDASMASSNRHCTAEQSRTCDWRICRTCGSAVAGRYHMHGAKTVGPCKREAGR